MGFWPGPQKMKLEMRKILNQETLNWDATAFPHAISLL
jgi:hypothetical protein